MKDLLIVANFKSNKTDSESLSYISDFAKNYEKKDNKKIVFCPSFTSLPTFSKYAKDSENIFIGAQNVSPFDLGPFTGEVAARQLEEFCKFCLVGHSERRINFAEDDSLIEDKVRLLLESNITPILCISSLEKLFLQENLEKCVVVFEPLESIGTGNPADPANAEKVSSEIKKKGDIKVLYGGSVDAQNVRSFTSLSSIDGVLIGLESLDETSFLEIIKNG